MMQTFCRTLYILSDSQAALKALVSFNFDSKLAWEYRKSLNQLARHNKVTLMWVPGHKGVEGNEIADQLAREGAQGPFYGPELFCDTMRCYLKEELRTWEKSQKETYWNNTPGQRQGKRFISYSPKCTQKLLKLHKNELKLVTDLLTGQGPWKYHLKKKWERLKTNNVGSAKNMLKLRNTYSALAKYLPAKGNNIFKVQ